MMKCPNCDNAKYITHILVSYFDGGGVEHVAMSGLREVLDLREVSFENFGLLVFSLKILGEFGDIVDLDVIKALIF